MCMLKAGTPLCDAPFAGIRNRLSSSLMYWLTWWGKAKAAAIGPKDRLSDPLNNAKIEEETDFGLLKLMEVFTLF